MPIDGRAWSLEPDRALAWGHPGVFHNSAGWGLSVGACRGFRLRAWSYNWIIIACFLTLWHWTLELNWLSSQDSLWYNHFLNDSLHVKVSSTTYRRRHEWLQSCYEMTLTELLYLTWPRSPQIPVSVEYSRLDTYLLSACSVCVRYTVGKHHNASVRSCSWCNFVTLFWTVKQLVDVKLKLGSVLWLFCTYMPRLFANGIWTISSCIGWSIARNRKTMVLIFIMFLWLASW